MQLVKVQVAALMRSYLSKSESEGFMESNSDESTMYYFK